MNSLDERIIKIPDRRLRQRTEEADFTTSVKTLDEMLRLSRDATNYGKNRSLAGLSSVQVELPGRVITWLENDYTGWGALINPVVVERSYEHVTRNEGCFSIQPAGDPVLFVSVSRPVSATFKGLNENEEEVLVELTNSACRYALHELDHIDGILITDYVPASNSTR